MTIVIENPASHILDGGSTFRSNDRESFELECMPYLDVLYRYAYGLTGDEMHADDLVQETMLKAYRAWHQFRAGTNVRAWLLTILRNTLYTEYRTARRQGTVVDLDTVESYVAFDQLSDMDPEGRFFDSLMDIDVQAAVERLPERFREAFLLSIEGLDYREIAEVLGVPIGTVRSRIHRARHSLRNELFAYAVREGHIRPPRPTNVTGQ